jgi:hypothetical protein
MTFLANPPCRLTCQRICKASAELPQNSRDNRFHLPHTGANLHPVARENAASATVLLLSCLRISGLKIRDPVIVLSCPWGGVRKSEHWFSGAITFTQIARADPNIPLRLDRIDHVI